MKFIILSSILFITPIACFVGPKAHHKPTRLFLEDRIAKIIDGELDRLQHKTEYENEWMRKNRGAILHQLADGETQMVENEVTDFRQYNKDVKMAKDDPRRYCVDRCLSTGNCDVYEDFFEFSPEEVISFCNDCVVDESKEECDIPDFFYELDSIKGKGLGP